MKLEKYCPCGRKLENIKDYFYKIVEYNIKGQMIFAICMHGEIIIDRKNK